LTETARQLDAKSGEVAVAEFLLYFAQPSFQVRPIEIVGGGVEGVFVSAAVVP